MFRAGTLFAKKLVRIIHILKYIPLYSLMQTDGKQQHLTLHTYIISQHLLGSELLKKAQKKW